MDFTLAHEYYESEVWRAENGHDSIPYDDWLDMMAASEEAVKNEQDDDGFVNEGDFFDPTPEDPPEHERWV